MPIVNRPVKYLNNIAEQDQRAVKRVTRPMRGFQSFRSPKYVLAGIKLMLMIRKEQLMMEGANGLFFANQFDGLAGNFHPI